MNRIRKFLASLYFVVASLTGHQAAAQIPVTVTTDAPAMLNQIEVMAQWAAQYGQMAQQISSLQQQYQQLQQTYTSMNGIRGMANVVNDPAARRYLPDEWQATMNAMQSGGGNKYPSLSGSFDQILAAMQPMDANTAKLGGNTATAYTGAQRQAAMNRAIGEEGYRQASRRFDSIQQLVDKINQSPDAKDIADLQARIQAEQVMQQNEATKLQLVAQLQQAQRDIQAQQALERRLKSKDRNEAVRF